MRGRPIAEIVIAVVAVTVCFMVVFTGVAVVLAEIFHPEADTSVAVERVGNLLIALVGLLAGYLTGRAQNGKGKPGGV